MTRPFAFLIFLFVTLALGGCATSPGDIPLTFSVLKTRVPTSPITAADIAPLLPTEQPYLLSRKHLPAQPLLQQRVETSRFDAQWSMVDVDIREQFLRYDEKGNMLLIAAIEHGDAAISFFDPPLIAGYAQLHPGESRSSETSMRVVHLNDPARQRESGRAILTITYINDSLIHTHLGDIWTRRLDISFKARLRFARVNQETTVYIDAQRGGLVVEESTKNITILGLIPLREHTLKIRDAVPVP